MFQNGHESLRHACRPEETTEERALTNTQLLIGGQWTAARSGEVEEVRSPFDGSVVGEVATAGLADVELALAAAERGAVVWRRTPAHERMRILLRAAGLADERTALIAATISAENGKTITEATTEAGRSGDLIRLSAFEGTQLYGDTAAVGCEHGDRVRQDRVHGSAAGGGGGGDHPVQFPVVVGVAQDRAGAGGGERGGPQACAYTPLTALALAACFVDAGLPRVCCRC